MSESTMQFVAATKTRPLVVELLASPLTVLSIALLACALMLTMPVSVPLGAMFWDLVLYLDAANRIAGGQVPSIDFFAPVGPLGYWLFAKIDALFPRAHPLLVAQWLTFVVTAPVMAMVLRDLDRRSRPMAFGLLAPYLIFQILPVNVEYFTIFPGFDGFGIYNRHVSIVLYALVSALVFVRNQRLLAAMLIWTMLALLFIKITGFVAGGLIVLFALFAGRLSLRCALISAAAAVAVLAAIEAATGLVSSYLNDIVALVMINSGGIIPRFAQAASLHLNVVAACCALTLALLIFTWRDIRAAMVALAARPSQAAFTRLFDRDVCWLGAVLSAGLFVETQNTGGQAFIFLIPALLPILAHWLGRPTPRGFVVLFLVAATAIPPLETVLQRAGRSLLAQTGYSELANDHLGRLGHVSQHRDVLQRAEKAKTLYAQHRPAFEAFARERLLPAHTLYSELDFQTVWLMAADDGVTAILDYETQTNTKFETIMSLNFANPFPWLMGRQGVKHIPIGADPFRSVPQPSAATLEAVAAADLVLRPLCPVTIANDEIQRFYEQALVGRREIALGPCWTGYVKSTLAEAGLRR